MVKMICKYIPEGNRVDVVSTNSLLSNLSFMPLLSLSLKRFTSLLLKSTMMRKKLRSHPRL